MSITYVMNCTTYLMYLAEGFVERPFGKDRENVLPKDWVEVLRERKACLKESQEERP